MGENKLIVKLKEKDLEQQDIHVSTTQKIWSYATGRIAFCLIFPPTRNAIITPIFVAGAASTAFVWGYDKKYWQYLYTNPSQQLEKSHANLEIIIGSGNLDLQNNIKQLPRSL